ncbi:2-C-methyl-D-erythritol 4-phosphate cytidylyltransferase [Acidiphilium iwatense]|uniref:2-C-methyl-D-erythritol 4-phosphate cytidylyltransferase n=1 Tax=Acidiphilium iwatense TaxID=768198 RepID=A0ABS9DSC7_9PROT|nr:2-C-methyl-D-erythritol 4-phosphate cytidylyltransferase [Acidiphilium iwatense]MCF3945638.1 2-C-methyl-D-erythritol 4-phosphate cytidylyltransferase [Acidiphilium iwatense]
MNVALIVAAGRGTRFGGTIPKQYRELAGSPVIRYTIAAFCRHPQIDAVQVLIHPSDLKFYTDATSGLDLLPPLIGGNTRQESVLLGLEGIIDLNPRKVIIHDAVRPFVEQETISAVLNALDRVPCAIAGLKVADTLKQCGQPEGVKTIDRTGIVRAQTPQGFRYHDILAAHRQIHAANPLNLDMTDDAMVAEHAGMRIEVVPGTDDNFKITTEEDLQRATAILERGHRETHTGWGFDSQPLRQGGHMTMCGIMLRPRAGMNTADRADIGLNAITRAVLGTVGGLREEPISGFTFRNIRFQNSEVLIRKAVSIVAMAGGKIEHIDLTLITDWEEITDSIADMVARSASLLSIPQGRVSIKCIETDDMGFFFRRDAIAAQCLATISYPADLPGQAPSRPSPAPSRRTAVADRIGS